jgi:hypothetical protein
MVCRRRRSLHTFWKARSSGRWSGVAPENAAARIFNRLVSWTAGDSAAGVLPRRSVWSFCTMRSAVRYHNPAYGTLRHSQVGRRRRRSVYGKSHRRLLFTAATPQTARVFSGRHLPHPAAENLLQRLLQSPVMPSGRKRSRVLVLPPASERL